MTYGTAHFQVYNTCRFSHVCSSILFKVLVSTHILDASEEIACVVLLVSLNFIHVARYENLRTIVLCDNNDKSIIVN